MRPCYADTSVIVSLIIVDDGAAAAARMVGRAAGLLVSDFMRAELAAAVARRVRMARLRPDEATRAFDALDRLASRSVPCHVEAEDIRLVEAWLRRLDMNLRAPGALHLAMARRLDAPLLTLDDGMAGAARALGIPLAA